MKLLNKLLLVFILFICDSKCQQFLKMDTFSTPVCDGQSYSSHLIALNNCNGNYIYKYVQGNAGGSTMAATTLATTTNPITTAGTLSTVDITSIVTQAVTVGMTTGVASLGNTGLLSGTPALQSNNLQEKVNSASLESPTSVTTGPVAQQTTTTSSLPSNPSTSTTNPSIPSLTTSGNELTTLNTLGLTSATSSSIPMITSIITDLISSSLTTGTQSGSNTGGNVQAGSGYIEQYYCLSIGCAAQCVSLAQFPLGTCTTNGLDHVKFSLANDTNSILKSVNTSNSPSSNGVCQSFISPNSVCLTNSVQEITQYNNNACGKGVKINCTDDTYNQWSCIDSNCDQCVKLNSFSLNKCIIQNSTGTTFKSLLLQNITEIPTFPPTNSSELPSSSHQSSSTLSCSPQLFLSIVLFIILSLLL